MCWTAKVVGGQELFGGQSLDAGEASYQLNMLLRITIENHHLAI